MKNGFRIGKIFGLDIHIDWSWLLIIALVIWSLVSSFQLTHPEWNNLMQWEVAILAALLFFASILAHELAHAVTARAVGLPVQNITLFLFGGISNIQKEPKSPLNELLITIVGPITSFVAGGFFLILGIGNLAINMSNPFAATSQFGPAETIFFWLGSINILIAVFNLIPGFPLDGGRIVRSILWAITNDLSKATRWASVLGQVVAWGLIFAGVSILFGLNIPFLGGGFINGIWMIFIGWFLQNAAMLSYRKTVIQDILEDVSVKQMMYTDVPSVEANLSIQNLIDNYIIRSDHRAFIVFENGNVVGLVTIDDVRGLTPESRSSTKISDVMTPSQELVVAVPDEEASEAFSRLQTENVRQLPVVNENKIIGLLRRKDIIRWLQLQSQFG